MKMKALFALCVVSIVLFAKPSFAQDYFIEKAARRYQASGWPMSSSQNGMVHHWVPTIPSFVLENAVVVTNLEENEMFERASFSWESSCMGEKLDLRMLVTPDFLTAKQALLTELGGMQSTMMLPRGTNELDHLGDICYGKLSSLSLVFFVRNNVFISCCSTFNHSSITNLLTSLDDQIKSHLTVNQ